MSFSSNQPLLSNQLPISIEFPLDPNRLSETLTDSYKRTVNAINSKVSGLFQSVETATFQQYFSATPNFYRSGYRYVFDMIALNGGVNIPGSATVTVTNSFLTSISMLTDIYGTATTVGGKMFGINYPNVYVTGNTLTFVNPEATALKQCQIVIEYLKE